MSIEVYPVVHIHEKSQGVDQALLALSEHADGVYLIDHHSGNGSTDLLTETFNGVINDDPNAFVGLNILQLPSAAKTFSHIGRLLREEQITRPPSGLWVDNAASESLETVRIRSGDPVLLSISYLGGIAFKYTTQYTDDPIQSASQARELGPLVDVVTTTGRGTGHIASTDKVRSMKLAIGNQRLALASGVSPENIANFGGLVDQVLVSTSIETFPGSGIFDKQRLTDLVNRAYQLA